MLWHDRNLIRSPGKFDLVTRKALIFFGIHLQVGATQAFKDIAKHILIWLDNWLLHASTLTQHMEIMEDFLALCRDWNFTLSVPAVKKFEDCPLRKMRGFARCQKFEVLPAVKL